MDSYSYSYSSGGEKLNIKTRKPYTITKQRERWTEDDHNSFLEALKLYGRAWQRIEEHIGTKTAVQIRSHAQKFFTKLEKEALAKGIPTKQALDIEIPPPRPKRKPNYPYPRKTDPQDGKQQATLVSSLQLLDLETKPLPETSSHQEKLEETSDQGEVPLQENENQGVCMPSLEEMNNHNESYITTTETRKYQDDTSNTSSLLDNLSQQPGVHNNYPRHVPVQVVDAKNSVPTFHELSSSSLNKSGVVDKNPLISSSSSSSYHQIVANIHPLLNPFCCDSQSSFLHVPSTISSLIVSSLVQNPAAHAAASFAATLWHPPQNAEASSRDHVNPPPSMAAIADATVAAAIAWWAAHGLLPVCTPPFYNPASSSTCPFSFGNGNQTRVDDTSNERDKDPSEQHLSSSSSEEEESDGKLNTPEEMVPPVVVVETTTTNVRKQVDRSSCGSNTTSSSEIETNALDKHVKEKEETKGSDDVNDSSSRGRTSRSSIIIPNESWKEVSEEGRLAFQALFSREVLPQSFSDTRRRDILDNNQLDLNHAAAVGESNGFAHLQQAVGLPSVKLNFNHTGFKPYKRCSIDAKETTKTIASSSSSTCNQNGDHKAPKRMRLETST